MTYSYKRANRDANQPAIVKALEYVGCFVIDLAPLGGGVPDLIAFREGATFLIEVKNPESKNGRHYASDGLTPAQLDWMVRYARRGPPVHVVRNVDEALAVVCPTEADREAARAALDAKKEE